MIFKTLITSIAACVVLTGCSAKSDNKTNIEQQNSKVEPNKNKNNLYTTNKKSQKVTEHHTNLPQKMNLPADLIRYMESALQNNKQIVESQHELLASHEQHNIDKAAFIPSIRAQSDLGASNNYRGAPYSEDDKQPKNRIKGERYEANANITISHNLFNGGVDTARLKSTDRAIEAKWKAHDALVQKVLQEVAQNYFEIVAKQQEIINIKALMKTSQENIKIAKEMMSAGAAKELDVSQANAAYYEAEAKLSKAEAEEQMFRAKLEELTEVKVNKKLITPSKLFDRTFSENEALDIAIKYNPQIRAAQAEYLAAKAKFDQPNAEFAPRVDISGSFGASRDREQSHSTLYDDISSPINRNIHYGPSAKLSVTVPIFDGGQSIAKKRQVAENLTKAAVTKRRVYNQIRTEIKQTLELLESSEKNIVSASKTIEAQQMVSKATNAELKAGTKILKDVLDAGQKLFAAQSALTTATKEKFVQQCHLMSLLGWFNLESLCLKGTRFDYRVEFNKQKNRIRPTYEELGINK